MQFDVFQCARNGALEIRYTEKKYIFSQLGGNDIWQNLPTLIFLFIELTL